MTEVLLIGFVPLVIVACCIIFVFLAWIGWVAYDEDKQEKWKK